MNRGFNKLRGRVKYNTPLCVQQLCNCTFGHANMAFWFNRPWAWSDNRSEPNKQKARTATAETTDCLESFHIIIYIYILNLKTFIDLCVLFLDISSWLVVLQLDPHPCWLHSHRCWWKPFIERINIDIFRPSPNDVAGKNHGWLIFLNQSIDLWFTLNIPLNAIYPPVLSSIATEAMAHFVRPTDKRASRLSVPSPDPAGFFNRKPLMNHEIWFVLDMLRQTTTTWITEGKFWQFLLKTCVAMPVKTAT